MRAEHNTKSIKGFTLVELSIVLVIIGLIIGSVLVGQDLITAAQTRSQLRQFDEINTALNTFRLKYNALPGDYGQAVANIGVAADAGAACTVCTGNGNSNSLLDDSDGATGGYGDLGDNEMLRFWHHLGVAGMLAGGASGDGTAATVGTTWPKSKIGNLGIVAFFSTISVPGGGQMNFYMGKTSGDLTNYGTFLSPQQAQEIDQKIDNGMANSGSLRARGAGVIDSVPAWSAVDGTITDCVDGPGSTSGADATNYNTIAGTGAIGIGAICNLRAKMSY